MIMLAHDFVDDALGAVYIVEVDLDTQYLSASGCMAPSCTASTAAGTSASASSSRWLAESGVMPLRLRSYYRIISRKTAAIPTYL